MTYVILHKFCNDDLKHKFLISSYWKEIAQRNYVTQSLYMHTWVLEYSRVQKARED